MARDLTPPPLAELILAACAFDAIDREVLLGDLAEEFAAIVAGSGARAARRWYWLQCLHSAGPLQRDALRRGGVSGGLRIVLAVLAGYVAIALLVVGAGRFLWAIHDYVPLELGSLAVSGVAAVLGGVVAAHVAPRTPLLGAAALGGACLVVGVALAVGRTPDAREPLWYLIALQLLIVPCAMLGGVLAVRRRSPP